jgi:hypothetical protein
MEDNHIKLHHTFEEGTAKGEIIIRHGEAERIYDPEQVVLEGIITVPSEYYQKRKDQCPAKVTHVIFDKEAKFIKLVVTDYWKFKSLITGRLTKHKFLKSLEINSTKHYSITELQKVLRYAKRFFADPEKHKSFIVSLRNFTAKITQTTTQADDRQGNKSNSFESRVEDFVKTSEGSGGLYFDLLLPIFYGTDPVSIRLTVEIEAINGAVALFLVCDDLDEIEDGIVTKVFETEKAIFSQLAIIDQS